MDDIVYIYSWKVIKNFIQHFGKCREKIYFSELQIISEAPATPSQRKIKILESIVGTTCNDFCLMLANAEITEKCLKLKKKKLDFCPTDQDILINVANSVLSSKTKSYLG